MDRVYTAPGLGLYYSWIGFILLLDRVYPAPG